MKRNEYITLQTKHVRVKGYMIRGVREYTLNATKGLFHFLTVFPVINRLVFTEYCPLTHKVSDPLSCRVNMLLSDTAGEVRTLALDCGHSYNASACSPLLFFLFII